MLKNNQVAKKLLSEVEIDLTDKEAVGELITKYEDMMTENGNMFNMLSLNHYLPNPIKDSFSLDEAITPIKTLSEFGFSIADNPLHYVLMTLSDDEITSIFEKYYDLGNIYLYDKINHDADVRNVVIGQRQTGEDVALGEIFETLVLTSPNVNLGDELPINTLFNLLLPLLRYTVAKTNLALIENDRNYVYQIG